MPRNLSIAAEYPPIEASITVRRAETMLVVLDPMVPNMIMTVAGSAGGEPIIEIPTSNGTLTISPQKVSTLTEGRGYFMNIWDATDISDPLQLVFGKFKTSDTIEPNFVEHPTQFLAGGPEVVILSRPEYDALGGNTGPHTIYVII